MEVADAQVFLHSDQIRFKDEHKRENGCKLSQKMIFLSEPSYSPGKEMPALESVRY